MARLMSVDIEFNGKTYLALVSVRQNEQEFTCQVRYMDDSLHYIHPNELLVFNLNEELKHPNNLPGEMAASLMNSTIAALRPHLHCPSKENKPV